MKHAFSYLLYCKYEMFYFLWKLPVPPLKNYLYPRLIIQPYFEIEIFWPALTDFLLKFFSLILEDGMQMPSHCQISWLPNK